MADKSRQEAFRKLRPVCVNLSEVALRFQTNQVPTKDVLQALESTKSILQLLGHNEQLDPKLAAYAFFPLAQQVFNQVKRLSPRCLEIAADCVTLLVQYGYKQSLEPDLGNQLLILMSMLAGSGPNVNVQPATDESKVAAFRCIQAVVEQLAKTKQGAAVFDNQGTKNVVDQLVYLLIEAVSESGVEETQLTSSEVLGTLLQAVKSRIFLASLLPRTVSSLAKVLKESTQVRRTQKVFAANLAVLRQIIHDVLNDDVAFHFDETLDRPWLEATTAQVKNALAQVVRLRRHSGMVVDQALENLCLMIIKDCTKSLSESVPMMLETMIILAAKSEGESARTACRRLLNTDPAIADMLRESFSGWSSSMPRLMQGHNDETKQLVLRKLTTTVQIMDEQYSSSTMLDQGFAEALVNSVSILLHDTSSISILSADELSEDMDLVTGHERGSVDFEAVILNHESQKGVLQHLQDLVAVLRSSPYKYSIAQNLVEIVADTTGDAQVSALWLSLQLLRRNKSSLDFDDILDMIESSDDRRALLSDLHAYTYPYIQSASSSPTQQEAKLIALSLESLIAYAETFPSTSYRPELVDTLYPVLVLTSSSSSLVRGHALTALLCLSAIAQYSNISDLLISNSDYLVNAIAWNLNIYSLTPQAPQILKLMVHLCGARIIPYLDDLIQSVFAALDTYHGYSEWVELLFAALKAIVDVSVKQPLLAITHTQKPPAGHRRAGYQHVTIDDILADMQARKKRKSTATFDEEELQPVKAPHRPWNSNLEKPTSSHSEVPLKSIDDNMRDDMVDDDDQPLKPMKPSDDGENIKLTKSHELLLSITRATTSHLTSPSARVRHLLLDLVKDITPLLATNENSFLPLVNAVWPTLVNRLFGAGDEATLDTGEVGYNICAAADAIAALCEGAGDFMASRIEEIAAQLVRMFRQVQREVEGESAGKRQASSSEAGATRHIRGTVDLQIVPASSLVTGLSSSNIPQDVSKSSSSANIRTSQGRILSALISLLMSILDFVQVTLDTGDDFCGLLLPFIGRKEGVRECCERWNGEIVRLWEQKWA